MAKKSETTNLDESVLDADEYEHCEPNKRGFAKRVAADIAWSYVANMRETLDETGLSDALGEHLIAEARKALDYHEKQIKAAAKKAGKIR